jgi:hexokinase
LKERTVIKEFLHKYRLDATEIDFEENCRAFLEEMTRGLEGKESTLKVIPTYIEPIQDVPVNEPVIVVDAGGTNLRVATVCFNQEKQPQISNFAKYPMPGSYKMMMKDEFFRALADCLEPLLDAGPRIGFCFSYPTEMAPNLDGRLISLTKEIKVEGVVGELIGENLLKAFRSKGYRTEKKIVLLNDTTAALLAGTVVSTDRTYDDYIGFILGTGMNTCYIESRERIKKVSTWENGQRMIINVESGNYGKAPRGALDLEFDSHQNNPGQYVFEKMISGAYLGKLVLTVLKKAAAEGIFSASFAKVLAGINRLETKDVNDFMHYPPSLLNPLTPCIKEGRDKDSRLTYWLMDAIIERGAVFAAVNLASLMLKTGKGISPCRPVGITAEGTTFYTMKGLKNKIAYYLKKYLVEEKGINYEFISVDHAVLIGSALAGLTGN